jgi:hypothetical protein
MSRAYFPHDFTAAQGWFTTQGAAAVKRYYPDAQLSHHPLPYGPQLTIEASGLRSAVGGQISQDRLNPLTIDYVTADPPRPETVYIVTTGLHGAEGLVGAAVMRLFINQFLPRLNHKTTGLALVQPINPWGMAQGRRVNGRNVDLNRNFFAADAPERYAAAINPEYDRLHPFLNPARPLNGAVSETSKFYLNAARALATVGAAGIRAGTLLGQYRRPQGIYYGGATLEPEAAFMAQLLRERLNRYAKIVLLDIHTGYGPRYQMSLVTSPRETATVGALARRFAYPLVVKTVPGEFYAIQGDMVDFGYQLTAVEFPGKQFFGAAFEFGTLGESTWSGLRSLQALIWENQAHWHGGAPATKAAANRRFQALFNPTEARWQEKVLADARRALAGILTDYYR